MTSSKDEEKKDKATALEDVAEETGELIGKSVKKTWNVMKSFGKGFAILLIKRKRTLLIQFVRTAVCQFRHRQTSAPNVERKSNPLQRRHGIW